MDFTTQELFAFFITILVGLLSYFIVGGLLNWWDAGSVFSIATMGVFILKKLDHNETDSLKENSDNKTP